MAEPDSSIALRLELFVADLDASADFYRRVLGFTVGTREPGGYTPMTNGAADIALNRRANLGERHPAHVGATDRPGRGVAIILETDDVEAACARVRATGWPLASPLKRQPWGQTDFAVADPDGYHLRVTSRT